jgi:hypothetical protein
MGVLGELLVNLTGYVSETARNGIARDNTHSYLVRDQDDVARWRIEDVQERVYFWTGSIYDLVTMGEVSEPDCDAVQHHHFRAFRQRFEGSCQVNRLLHCVKRGIPLTAVAFDAGPHLIIGGFGGGNEDLVIIGGGELQGTFTLAASAAPGYKDDPFHWQKFLFLFLHSHPGLDALMIVVLNLLHFGY